jgi:uracil DNA glycosylase
MSENNWTPWLHQEWEQPYFKKLAEFVHEEYEHQSCLSTETSGVRSLQQL